jgi:hypothetical protein
MLAAAGRHRNGRQFPARSRNCVRSNRVHSAPRCPPLLPGNAIIGSERRVSPNLKAFGSRSRSASDASVATAGPCNHRPAVRPTPCRLAALCPWQRARISKPGRVRWPEPPGLAAGSRTRGEAPEECGAWSGLPRSVAPSHAPVDRTLRFLPLDCAAPSGWTIAPATSGLSELVGTMVARSPRQRDLRRSAAGAADRRHRARGVRQLGRVALPATRAAACAAATPIAGRR